MKSERKPNIMRKKKAKSTNAASLVPVTMAYQPRRLSNSPLEVWEHITDYG
jgi:hypothetical protein